MREIVAMAGVFLLFSGYQAAAVDKLVDETMSVSKFLQPWQQQPKLPQGWQEIYRAEGRLTTKTKEKDIFVLAMDDQNIMFFWFRKGKSYWEMIVLDSGEIDGYRKAKVDPKRLKIVIQEGSVMYGLEGTEALDIYKWDEDKQAFIGYR